MWRWTAQAHGTTRTLSRARGSGCCRLRVVPRARRDPPARRGERGERPRERRARPPAGGRGGGGEGEAAPRGVGGGAPGAAPPPGENGARPFPVVEARGRPAVVVHNNQSRADTDAKALFR